MKNIIKKSVLLGIGIGALTKEKADKFAKDLQKKGYLNINEGKKLVRSMITESVKAQKKIQSIVDVQVKRALDKNPVATKKDLKDLEKKLKVKKKAKTTKKKK